MVTLDLDGAAKYKLEPLKIRTRTCARPEAAARQRRPADGAVPCTAAADPGGQGLRRRIAPTAASSRSIRRRPTASRRRRLTDLRVDMRGAEHRARRRDRQVVSSPADSVPASKLLGFEVADRARRRPVRGVLAPTTGRWTAGSCRTASRCATATITFAVLPSRTTSSPSDGLAASA